MDTSSLMNVLVFQLLDPEISGITPREQFARCVISPEFAQICTTFKARLWSSYFHKDILPYLNLDNASGVELKHQYERLALNMNEQPFETMHKLYLKCLRNIVLDSWWWSQQAIVLLRYLRSQGKVNAVSMEIVNKKLQELGLPAQGYEIPLQKLIKWTSARIYKICEIRKRTKIPLEAKFNPRDPDPTLGLHPKKVRTYIEFAVWSLDVALMRELIAMFQNWFYDYTTASFNESQYDLLRLLIDEIIEIEKVYENEEIAPLIRLFTETFIIPTARNPKGRYCVTYSAEVRQRLRPILGRSNAGTSIGDHFMESMWENEVNHSFPIRA